jgi:hypothetical protein
MSSYATRLCVKDRKVWKQNQSWFNKYSNSSAFCPTCGNAGLYMGTKWRAPKLNNKAAWAKIDKGQFLWDQKTLDKSRHSSDRVELERNRNPKYLRSLIETELTRAVKAKWSR